MTGRSGRPHLGGPRARSAGEITPRSENVDPAEGMKGEEVGVARDNQLRGAIDGQLEKLVVCGIASRRDALGDRHQLGGGQHLDHAVTKRRIVTRAR